MKTSASAVSRARPTKSNRSGVWMHLALFAVCLILAPQVFTGGASVSLLAQMGIAMILCLSYNMLLGQGGMLSFGHALYSGLGAFFTIHAMNLASAGKLWIPVTMIPLVGGLVGMLVGVVIGYVTTRQSGTTFAMITLGIVELASACSLMFPEFFGGESGIATNRSYGDAFFGFTFGTQIQVYYLIAFWLFISTVSMYAFTQTPLGRIINAVRDNPERVQFIGYNPHWARYLTLILSGFFAGISGGLSAISFEIVTAENVSAIRSGAVLLFTFIGGVGFFFGPVIGTVIGVFLTVMLSDFTKAWQLYLGVFFIAIVMYAPNGVTGIIMLNLRVVKFGKFRKVFMCMAPVIGSALVGFVGMVMIIEMLYHLTLESASGTSMKLFWAVVDTATVQPWLLALALMGTGVAAFLQSRPGFGKAWGEVNSEIEEAIRRAA
jgi:branched-chain amino acid transport system permease protein